MKAIISKIFNNKDSYLRYTYVNTAKFRDDVEAVYHYEIKAPMMGVRLYNEDGTLGEETVMYASPDVVETYTLIDFFKILKQNVDSYEFSIHTASLGCCWEIEFDMVRGEYPYLNFLVCCESRDELLPPIVDYPKIIRMYKHSIW